MFPNVRWLFAAMLASIVVLSGGFGLFASLRVMHEPLTHLPPGAGPPQSFADNTDAPATPTTVAPFQSRFPADSRPIVQVAADLHALRLDRDETSAPIEPPAAQQEVAGRRCRASAARRSPRTAQKRSTRRRLARKRRRPLTPQRNHRGRIDRTCRPGCDQGCRPDGDRPAAQGGRAAADIRETQGHAPAKCRQTARPPTRRHQDASRTAAAPARQRRGSDSGGAAGVSRSAVPGPHVPEPDAGASKYAIAATRRRQRADGWPLRARNRHRSVLDWPPHGIDGGCASTHCLGGTRVLSCVA